MYPILIYTLISFAWVQYGFLWEVPAPQKPEQSTVVVLKEHPLKPRKPNTVPTKIGTLDHHIALMKVSFENLPGWDKAHVTKSLHAFQLSCKTFLKQNPKHAVGSVRIKLKAGDWKPACDAASLIDSNSEEEARLFFETWFNPIEFKQAKKSTHGLFTGYYMPEFNGSLKRTKNFTTPIYGLPKGLNWETHHKHYYTREQIDKGLMKKKAPVIAWIKNPVERLFLEIEGSGVIKLNSGKKVYLDYAGENGAPYTSIGKLLIKKGVMTRDTASKAAITNYLTNHPSKIDPILHKNKSFVFFQRVEKPSTLGAQGATLTPGYSLAIDKKWIPLGAPLWLNATQPDGTSEREKQFRRLMIAQDTGGAIRGLMRGDVFWGCGKRATFLGEHMKNEGRFWLLLPKYALRRLTMPISA
ncbi:MAG: MltA domain-containing protein [Legionella sp.]|nr:MltA domain-containing protein [Legionella sp.]